MFCRRAGLTGLWRSRHPLRPWFNRRSPSVRPSTAYRRYTRPKASGACAHRHRLRTAKLPTRVGTRPMARKRNLMQRRIRGTLGYPCRLIRTRWFEDSCPRDRRRCDWQSPRIYPCRGLPNDAFTPPHYTSVRLESTHAARRLSPTCPPQPYAAAGKSFPLVRLNLFRLSGRG